MMSGKCKSSNFASRSRRYFTASTSSSNAQRGASDSVTDILAEGSSGVTSNPVPAPILEQLKEERSIRYQSEKDYDESGRADG